MVTRFGRLLAPCLATLAFLVSACAAPAETDRLRGARYVLLGEVHDNPAHHRERAELLRDLLADGRPTRVLFEQMPRGTEAAIAAAARDAESVVDAGRLDRRGWRWPLHRPLVDAALAGGATITGANLERGDARAVMRDGAAALPPDLQALLALPWSAEQQSRLERTIDEGHCGLLPRDSWPAMALAQRARDAAMARSMLQVPAPERVVLIAGNGHVREDIGVPHYLRGAGVPERDIAAVAFLEDGDTADPGRFDLVRRSPPAPRADPCETLRR
jgi:uncharacterized iron-regulated protein